MTQSTNHFLDPHEAEILLSQNERLAAMAQSATEVIHEIRNPLATISLNLELLEDEICLAKEGNTVEAEELLKASMGEVERIARLTGEFLQFATLPKDEMSS